MNKKEKELIPPKVEELQNKIPDIELPEVISSEEDIKFIPSSESGSDSFFKHIIKELFGLNNISLKTEYLNVTENFVGTKLDFLSKYGNMPYLEEFMQKFEIKRVSLGRKGRKEILMALLDIYLNHL